ncbi:MAG: glycosyltransferase family 4 protein, partial [Terracidiphilus sp.]
WWRHFERYALVGHVHNVHDPQSILMGLADRVIAVSESVGKTIAAWGISRRKVRVVLNRTLNGARQPRLKDIEPAAVAKPAIVTVCGMNPRKGIEELLTAFDQVAPQFPDAQLYLVGDGPERSWFELLARRSPHFSQIHFEGYRAVPQSYMLSADVFVLAARRESFGLVLLEARAAGCAIVATNADGIAEALDGGRSGMLVPTRNSSALANALCHMLGNDEMRVEWRRRAKLGIEEYSIERMAHEVGDVYDEIVGEKRWRESPRIAA